MATFESIGYNSPDGSQWGQNASDKVALYGATPVTRRAFVASRMDTTAIASSTDFTAAHLAVINEIQNTLRGLGIWPTA